MGYIRNVVLIHASLEDVFSMTNDVRTWPDLFTEYASSEVLAEEKDSVTFRLTTHPDETGTQWSWISTRWTNSERKSTHSERDPANGPFQQMTIRWWYDRLGEKETVMTWEQQFSLKPEAPFDDLHATKHLDTQTHIQQRVIKERIEKKYGHQEERQRGIIFARYQPGSEEKIVEAFRRSDATSLPRQIGVTSRHVWVQGEHYVHFVEARTSLSSVLKQYAQDPLFQEVKAELDQYVSLVYPNLPPMAREIYHWYAEPGEQ